MAPLEIQRRQVGLDAKTREKLALRIGDSQNVSRIHSHNFSVCARICAGIFALRGRVIIISLSHLGQDIFKRAVNMTNWPRATDLSSIAAVLEPRNRR